MKGFDYTKGTDVDQSVALWRAQMKEVLDEKGFRRVENGETFAHGRDGKIVFEVYGNVAI
jgi:hypothetical protein